MERVNKSDLWWLVTRQHTVSTHDELYLRLVASPRFEEVGLCEACGPDRHGSDDRVCLLDEHVLG